jgi:putative spermidine/putrescine transport system permease protein
MGSRAVAGAGADPVMSPRPYSIGLVLFAGLVLAFILVPVAFICLYAFNDVGYLRLPPQALTLKWFVNFFDNPRFRQALESSLLISAVVAPACLLIALPASVALVRYRFAGRDMLNGLMMSPLIVPGVVIGISFLSLSSRLGAGLGLWPVIVALTCFAFPFAVRALVANLHGLDPRLEEAARNLGSRRWQAFLWVTLPQLRPGLLAGAIFVFVEAIDNFSIAVFLTNSRTTTLPVESYSYIRDFDDPTVAAVAVLLMALSVALVMVLDRLVGLDRFLEMK